MSKQWVRYLVLVACVCRLASADSSDKKADASQTKRTRQLVRQLNSPRAGERAEAEKKLGELGPEALPVLNESLKTASFEERAGLERIIRTLEKSRTGVLVVHVAPKSSAEAWRIRAGDILFQIDDTRIDSPEQVERLPDRRQEEELYRLQFRGEKGPYQKKAFSPSGLVPWLSGYDPGTYGQPLEAAVRAAGKGRYAEALRHFEELDHCAAQPAKTVILQCVRAMCHYYAGQRQRAYECLEKAVDLARASNAEKPWLALDATFAWAFDDTQPYGQARSVNGSGEEFGTAVYDGHMRLYVSKLALQRHPDARPHQMSLAHFSGLALRRYPESIAAWLPFLAGQGEKGYHERPVALLHLYRLFQGLQMDEEMEQVCRYAIQEDYEPHVLDNFAPVFEDLGDLETAIELRRQYAFKDDPTRTTPHGIPFELLRLYVEAGQPGKAEALLDSCEPETALDSVNDSGGVAATWSVLAPAWARIARRALKARPDDEYLPGYVEGIFLGQPNPDLDEARQFVHRRQARAKGDNPYADTTKSIPKADIQIALLENDFETAWRLLSTHPRYAKGTSDPFYEAVKFLHLHGASLTGDRAAWRRTCKAYAIPNNGGWMLVTRDQHIGHALPDASVIAELPMPEGSWLPDPDYHNTGGPEDVIWISKSGQTIIVINGHNRLYVLDVNAHRWVPLTRLNTPKVRGYVEALLGLQDEWVGCVRSLPGGPHEWVYPTSREPDFLSRSPAAYLLFSNGAWMQYEPDKKRVRVLDQVIAEKLGQPVEIYGVRPARDTRAPAFLFTSRGMLRYQHRDDAVQRFQLPDRDGDVPVTWLTGGAAGDGDTLRFGLLPDAGGATYRLDIKTGRVTAEGCINEAYPTTYWRHRPIEWKRDRVRQAVIQAGHDWPIRLDRSRSATSSASP